MSTGSATDFHWFIHGPNALVDRVSFRADEVEAIHVMFATPGRELVSRFGHLMLRLKLRDRESLVVSYRGQVTDYRTSSWKGVTRGYRLYPFCFPLRKSFVEYRAHEGRALRSAPLMLDDAERAKLLNALDHEYWNYSTGYHFLRTNCSNEIERLLCSLRPPPFSGVEPRYRPDRFFEWLLSSGIAGAVETEFPSIDADPSPQASAIARAGHLSIRLQRARLDWLARNPRAKPPEVPQSCLVARIWEQYPIDRALARELLNVHKAESWESALESRGAIPAAHVGEFVETVVDPARGTTALAHETREAWLEVAALRGIP